jgi:hypothetical protein
MRLGINYFTEVYILVNNYPEWWDSSVTVYNKYEDPATRQITWYKTVLHNCFWKYTGNKIVVGETTLETNTTLCRVPVNTAFLEKYKWEAEPNKQKYFTFGTGDIIVKGEVEDTVDEYLAGHRSSDLLTKYKKLQGCMVIEQCATNTGTGRGSEHYYVRGV